MILIKQFNTVHQAYVSVNPIRLVTTLVLSDASFIIHIHFFDIIFCPHFPFVLKSTCTRHRQLYGVFIEVDKKGDPETFAVIIHWIWRIIAQLGHTLPATKWKWKQTCAGGRQRYFHCFSAASNQSKIRSMKSTESPLSWRKLYAPPNYIHFPTFHTLSYEIRMRYWNGGYLTARRWINLVYNSTVYTVIIYQHAMQTRYACICAPLAYILCHSSKAKTKCVNK